MKYLLSFLLLSGLLAVLPCGEAAAFPRKLEARVYYLPEAQVLPAPEGSKESREQAKSPLEDFEKHAFYRIDILENAPYLKPLRDLFEQGEKKASKEGKPSKEGEKPGELGELGELGGLGGFLQDDIRFKIVLKRGNLFVTYYVDKNGNTLLFPDYKHLRLPYDELVATIDYLLAETNRPKPNPYLRARQLRAPAAKSGEES